MLDERCTGCKRIVTWEGEEPRCAVFPFPKLKWRVSDCPMATHLKKGKVESKKVNPLKQAKRDMRAKKQ